MNKSLLIIVLISSFGMLVSSASGQLGSQHFGDISTDKKSTSDGSTWVYVTSTDPKKGERMSITVDFRTLKGAILEDVNYDIEAVQDGNIILDEKDVNANIGSRAHLTTLLTSSNSVDILITLNDSNSIRIVKTLNSSMDLPYNFPNGEKIQTTTVPEFGNITMITLIISILTIVGITSKIKLVKI